MRHNKVFASRYMGIQTDSLIELTVKNMVGKNVLTHLRFNHILVVDEVRAYFQEHLEKLHLTFK